MSRLKLAYDRSVRSVDVNGILHVAVSNISKATVNPYRGSEIPDQEGVTLDPNKIYNLLRDPEELAKAAPTFNNLPLLDRHIPVSAEEPQSEFIVGTTGTDAVFEAPYLRNSLSVWTQDAIDLIESDAQKELSSAYRYEVDWTPGIFEGLRYDGIMRNILGNHVAIVESGRAGSDVVVGDAKLEITPVKLHSRTALLLAGALAAYMTPKMAADSKLNLEPILTGITRDNVKAKKADIAKAVKKLATDADLEAVLDLIDAVTTVDDGPDKLAEEMPAADDEDGTDLGARIMAALKGKVPDELLTEIGAMCGGGAADDADGPPAVAGEPKDKPMDKPAMDAAIKIATDATVARMNAIREAEDLCQPIIGKLKVAQDSAAAIYKMALDAKGIEVTDVHESAFKALVVQALKADGEERPNRQRLATDSANTATWFKEQFPTAKTV